MAEGKQEEDSSSQRDSLQLTVSSVKGTSEGGAKLELSDGSFFILSPSFVQKNQFFEGMGVSEELIEQLQTEDLWNQIKSKAMRLISIRPHFINELKLKLSKSFGGQQKLIKSVLNYLEEQQQLNDFLVEKLYRFSLLQKGKYSSSEIEAKIFSRKGSPSEIRDDLEFEAEKEELAAQRFVSKWVEKGYNSLQISEHLYRKGFSRQIIKKVNNQSKKNDFD